jgi:DNA-binding protein H-NS
MTGERALTLAQGTDMASIDLDRLSLTELKSLQKEFAKAIADFGNRKKVEPLGALEEHAKALGFSLAELTGVKVRRAQAESGVPKYRHPDSPDVTWSGRGRKPAWFIAAIDSGKAAESIVV